MVAKKVACRRDMEVHFAAGKVEDKGGNRMHVLDGVLHRSGEASAQEVIDAHWARHGRQPCVLEVEVGISLMP